MPSKKVPLPIDRLKITLIGIEPPIWRRIEVPGSTRLCCLHSAFQVVMGWTDSHLHQFEKDGKNWGVSAYDEFDELDLIDESKTQLAKLLTSEGESMIYVYDFGDNWRHEVVLEKIIPVNDPVKIPICVGGARRCPPEDVGGVSGYQDFWRSSSIQPTKSKNTSSVGLAVHSRPKSLTCKGSRKPFHGRDGRFVMSIRSWASRDAQPGR